jgi:hypothetical protein
VFQQTLLTDVVVKAQQCPREFPLCHSAQLCKSHDSKDLVLPLFMTTHILEPIHESINSVHARLEISLRIDTHGD